MMDKRGLLTTCGSIPFRSLKEVGHIINKLKRDFENKVSISVLDDCVYYEHKYTSYK